MATQTQLKQVLSKLLWIGIPLFISLMIWLVTAVFEISKNVEVVKTASEERHDLQEKIYTKVEANYTVLQSKADEAKNDAAHNRIEERIKAVECKVDKLYLKTGLALTIDTTHQDNMCNRITERIDCVNESINNLTDAMVMNVSFPLKDSSMMCAKSD